jgi:hypothetical protein
VSEGKRVTARPLLALLTGALLSIGATACGGARNVTGSAPRASSDAHAATSAPLTTITSSLIPRGQSLRGDGDADNPGDLDGNGDRDSSDSDSDGPTPESYNFPDKDDKATFAYGHSASGPETRALRGIVKRYYAAASSGDGAAACSLLLPSLARSVPEDYSKVSGPSYLRGGKTCQAVMSMLFRHFRKQLAEAITVVGVRVEGSTAQAVFSSRRMPASNILLMRQGSSWKVASILGQPLP